MINKKEEIEELHSMKNAFLHFYIPISGKMHFYMITLLILQIAIEWFKLQKSINVWKQTVDWMSKIMPNCSHKSFLVVTVLEFEKLRKDVLKVNNEDDTGTSVIMWPKL